MKQNITLLIAFVGLTLTGCNNKPITEEQGFEYGKVNNGRYTNTFFDIQINVPKTWFVQSQEQSQEIMDEGQKIVAGDNENMKRALKASEINSAGLLTVFKYEQGAAVAFNPSIMLVAENLKNAPGIKSGNEYLFHSRKLMVAGQIKYTRLDEKFEKRVINGWEFYVMNAAADYNGTTVSQTYIATVKDKFALAFIYSYADDEQKAELEKLINTIDFYKKK